MICKKRFRKIHNDAFGPQLRIPFKILRITSPEVRQVWSGKHYISRLEGMNVVADEARACSSQYSKELVFGMKMPVMIKMRRLQEITFEGPVRGDRRFLQRFHDTYLSCYMEIQMNL